MASLIVTFFNYLVACVTEGLIDRSTIVDRPMVERGENTADLERGENTRDLEREENTTHLE